MTLAKAIKTLKLHTHYAYKVKNPELLASLNIGIEAVKVVQDIKGMDPLDVDFMLPGETKED